MSSEATRARALAGEHGYAAEVDSMSVKHTADGVFALGYEPQAPEGPARENAPGMMI